MEKQLKEKIRSVVRGGFISELSKNDVHVKEIMKFYDKGTYSTKKAVSIFVSGKTNATRNQILDDLGDMGYNDAWEVMDHFKLKIESVNEAAVPTGERIQKLNNRIKALRDKLSATKSPEQKKLFQDRLKNALQTLSNIKKDYSIKKESVTETALNEGFGDSIKKIRALAIKMASTKYDRAKSHLNLDKIASAGDFDGKDTMNKATTALLQQNDLDEDLKSAINKIAVKLGTGATMMGIITALVSISGWIQYLDSSFTKWYYTEIQKLAEPEVMDIMQDLGRAGQAEGSIYAKLGMYAFFIFFTIAVISLVAARMTKANKNEADVVPGGLAKGLSLNDIAEKHGVSVDMMVAEFKKGIAVEMEHTTDREVAKEITLDHLFEDPKYYDKLKKVEEYVDKKGVEHVAAALPQTEEEPIKECKTCNSK
jgi:heterodisulfide reductase subunit C